jgi:signal transduction histidine kinase
VEIRHLAHEAITMARRDPSCQDLSVSVEGGPATVIADAELVRGTLLNLLLNAGQAMSGRGRVVVRLSGAGGKVVLAVADDGPGVPEALRPQVFEPFFTTKARGGGLGLAVAKRTAEIHGGDLTLECPPAGGTIVTLTLPAAQTRASERPAAALT